MATKKKLAPDVGALLVLLDRAVEQSAIAERERRGTEAGAIADGRAGAFDAVREYLRGHDHWMKVHAGSD